MGACEFKNDSAGRSAGEAFAAAVDSALWDHGHGGYSGTIAEKRDFTVVLPEDSETPMECVGRHIEANTFGDKWGPAGCVDLGDGHYRFFGKASS